MRLASWLSVMAPGFCSYEVVEPLPGVVGVEEVCAGLVTYTWYPSHGVTWLRALPAATRVLIVAALRKAGVRIK